MDDVLPVRPKYRRQRGSKVPPHVPIKYVRLAAKLSIDAVIARIRDQTGRTYSRGSISAIENGHRGASSEVLEAFELAYDLPLGSIVTDYVPRAPRVKRVAAAEAAPPSEQCAGPSSPRFARRDRRRPRPDPCQALDRRETTATHRRR